MSVSAELLKLVSSKTIYTLCLLKTFLWGAGMILFDAHFYVTNPFFWVGEHPLTKYSMVIISLLGLANLRWQSYRIYSIVYIYIAALWTYVTLGFGVSSDFTSSSFLRAIPELLFLYISIYFFQKYKGLIGHTSTI